MKRTILLLIAVLLPVSLYSEPSTRIAWEPVPGAWGYALEIKDSGGKIIVSKEIRDSYYSVSDFEPGEYSFRIATLNMIRQKGENTGWTRFTIEKFYMPDLKSISRNQIISSYSNDDIIVKGKNFRKESVFLLRGNGVEIKLTDVDIISDNEASIDFEPSDEQRGTYDLVLVNRGDAESVLKNAVQIVASTEAKRSYYIGAGYLVNRPVGPWADYMAPSYAGIDLYFQFSLKNPVFENILFETEIDASQFANVSSVNTSSLKYLSLGLGAGYYYPLPGFNIQLFAKMNAGMMYSILTLDDNVVGDELTSYDWFVKFGTGARVFIGESFFVEPALSWKTAFFTGDFFHVAEVSLSGGMRF